MKDKKVCPARLRRLGHCFGKGKLRVIILLDWGGVGWGEHACLTEFVCTDTQCPHSLPIIGI